MFRNNKNIYFSDSFYLEACLCLWNELEMFFSNFTLGRSNSSVVKGWAPSHLAADSVAVCNTCGVFLAWPHSGLRLFSWEHCQVGFISDHFRVPAAVSAMFYLSLSNFLQRNASWYMAHLILVWVFNGKENMTAPQQNSLPSTTPHLLYLWTNNNSPVHGTSTWATLGLRANTFSWI